MAGNLEWGKKPIGSWYFIYQTKNPPSEVQFEGLPLNVVPIYPTTNNIYASLPNDDRILVTHMQVEVLVNFAITDFGSQGKTQPYNVCDLNNLQTHQSYYTALSWSASAEGTLILQGFDPWKFTGKCSGALRQEFGELEILDEITWLRYEGKHSVKVYGNIQNTLIKKFCEWKGQQYVQILFILQLDGQRLILFLNLKLLILKQLEVLWTLIILPSARWMMRFLTSQQKI